MPCAIQPLVNIAERAQAQKIQDFTKAMKLEIKF